VGLPEDLRRVQQLLPLLPDPAIRGPHASRSRAAVLDEARALVDAGVRELNLVGQDITRFGEDRRGRGLASLVRAVGGAPGDFRVRLLYLHLSGSMTGSSGSSKRPRSSAPIWTSRSSTPAAGSSSG